jgi:alpha-galactosidase
VRPSNASPKIGLNLVCISAAIAICSPLASSADYNGLAKTPPMGWNNFNWFRGLTTESQVKAIVDSMVSSGLRDAGYVYVNLDDGWMEPDRDSDGNIQTDTSQYPDGMKALTDYIHARGMKAGTYLCDGPTTFEDLPGSLGHEEKDARTIASYGFDLLKYDYRNDGDSARDPKPENIRMSNELKKTGRPILFSMCDHGTSAPWTWAAKYANMWRVEMDIKDQWDGALYGGWGFNDIVDSMAGLESSSGPGHWNDPDILLVGLHGQSWWMGPGCTDLEYRSHFSLWCLMAAPLLLGNDPSNMTEATKRILLNAEMIAVDQDSLGIQGKRVKSSDGYDVWVKPLRDNSWAVGLYNRTDAPARMSVDWHQIGIASSTRAWLRDLWAKSDIIGASGDGSFTDSYSRNVASHECAVVRVTTNATTSIRNAAPEANSPWLQILRSPRGITFRCTEVCDELSLIRTNGQSIPLSEAPVAFLPYGKVAPGVYMLRALGPAGSHVEKVLIDR